MGSKWYISFEPYFRFFSIIAAVKIFSWQTTKFTQNVKEYDTFEQITTIILHLSEAFLILLFSLNVNTLVIMGILV